MSVGKCHDDCLSLPRETSWVGGWVGERRLLARPGPPATFSGSGGIVSGSRKAKARPHPAATCRLSTCPAGPRAGVHSLGWGHLEMEENQAPEGLSRRPGLSCLGPLQRCSGCPRAQQKAKGLLDDAAETPQDLGSPRCPASQLSSLLWLQWEKPPFATSPLCFTPRHC